MGKKREEQLEKTILRNRMVFFQSEDGDRMTRGEFIDQIRTGEDLPKIGSLEGDACRFLDGDDDRCSSRLYANWMRLREMHLWDYPLCGSFRMDHG